MTPKQQIQALLDQLPDDASFLEIQEHLNSYGGARDWPKTVTTARSGAEAFAAWQEIVSI